MILIIPERFLEKIPTRTFNPSLSFLAFYKRKTDIEGKNSNKNGTIKTNNGHYTD